MKAVCVRAFPKIKDHLSLLVCKIMWGDIGNKTNLFSIRKNILCWDSSVFSETGLDYCSALAFKVSFNNTASLAGVKSTRPPNTHCHILSSCQMISFCLCTLFAIKKNIKQGPVCCFQASVCVCICYCVCACISRARWVCTQTRSKLMMVCDGPIDFCQK